MGQREAFTTEARSHREEPKGYDFPPSLCALARADDRRDRAPEPFRSRVASNVNQLITIGEMT
jgi:hypothetical protein